MNFKDLGLTPELLSAVESAGYSTPTPIQVAAVPPTLAGRDVLGCAQTGTGKTAAFCLPILQRADKAAGKEPTLSVLILTPTRELAAQIGESITTYGRNLDLWHTVLFGGVNEKPQIAELKKGIDILVATPGRLLDLMQRGYVDLSRITCFVLDEADRMLDMGFINDVRKITKKLPARRQTLFFSATMPEPIRELADGLLNDPVVVAVDPVSSAVGTVTQEIYFTDKGSKRDLLVHILRERGCARTIVFARTKHGSDRVTRHLQTAGITAAAIHGNKAQNARIRALEGFRAGEVQVLVATDIAARGIDVNGISHVVNFDIPNVPETYVHRIGRTGRAGQSGSAIALCDFDERDDLFRIERLMGLRLQRVEEHPFPQTETTRSESSRQPSRGQGRGRQNHGGQGRGPRNHGASNHGSGSRGASGQGGQSRQANGGQGSGGQSNGGQGSGRQGNGGQGRSASGQGAQGAKQTERRPNAHSGTAGSRNFSANAS